MMNLQNRSLLVRAWLRLLRAYMVAFFISLVAGYVLVVWVHVDPLKLFEVTTKRVAVAGAVFEKGILFGIDTSILLFVWNCLGALATISFIYSVSWINPAGIQQFPSILRKALVGKSPMRALCFLPGCAGIEEEPVRRAYVWLMVPLLGIILLGTECGFIVSTAAYIYGSYLAGLISLLPHGIIEIPAFAMAGAVTFSAHLLVKEKSGHRPAEAVFKEIAAYRSMIPIRLIALLVILLLQISGVIEGHITPKLMAVFIE